MIYTVTLNPALDKTVVIPSFATGEVNRITSVRQDPGGKGINVSKVIQKLNRQSVAMGILGGDTGAQLKRSVEDLGIETCFVFAKGVTRTNLKIIDPVLKTNTDINEPGLFVSEALLERLRQSLLERLRSGDLVVFSGSIPGGCPVTVYRDWILDCKALGAKTFLDADGEQFAWGLKAAPYLIKPNHHELSAFVGRQLETVEDIRVAAEELMATYGIAKLVVSMGERGALYLSGDETIYAEGLSVPVGSTVGAGDSVVAAMAVSEVAGSTLSEAAAFSTAVGAANVMCAGSEAAEYAAVAALLPQVKLQRRN